MVKVAPGSVMGATDLPAPEARLRRARVVRKLAAEAPGPAVPGGRGLVARVVCKVACRLEAAAKAARWPASVAPRPGVAGQGPLAVQEPAAWVGLLSDPAD